MALKARTRKYGGSSLPPNLRFKNTNTNPKPKSRPQQKEAARTANFGVLFRSPWAMWGNGICTAWRRLARAISDAGVAISMDLDALYGQPHPSARAEVADLLNRNITTDVFLGGFPTAGDPTQAAVINKLLLSTRLPVVLTTMIERHRIGPESVAIANQVKQWWLPNAANIEAFAASGVRRDLLRKVPIPYFRDDPLLRLVGRKRERGPTHFYRIGVVDTRKDQAKMLRAFLAAFSPGEAHLTIKTSAVANNVKAMWSPTGLAQFWQEPAALQNGWSAETFERDVVFINAFWGPAQILDLHRRGDVYLSLSHGEGWDMPAFDAALAGNRLIYTESGGPQDFASDGDLLVPTSKFVPCDPVYGWERDAQWLDFDLAIAAQQMRYAHEHPLPKEHRRDWTPFTSETVGKLARNLLAEVYARSVPRQEISKRLSLAWTDSTQAQQNLITYTDNEQTSALLNGPSSAQGVGNKTELVLVYRPSTIPCGVASHTMYLRDAHPRAAWVKTLNDAWQVIERGQTKALVLQVPLGAPSPTSSELELLRHIKARVRVVVNHHHAERSTSWLQQLRLYVEHSHLIVFHNTDAPRLTGVGIYIPLPVPAFTLTNLPWLGGLTFMGFADPTRCIDKLVAVGERLGVPVYGYGPRLDQIPKWYDTRGWKQYRPMRSYLSDEEGASQIARHSVALFARRGDCKAYASASARFCIAAKIPVVIDASTSYHDLHDVVAAVVDYDNPAQTDAVIGRLLSSEETRRSALQRQESYAKKASAQAVLNAMGVVR